MHAKAIESMLSGTTTVARTSPGPYFSPGSKEDWLRYATGLGHFRRYFKFTIVRNPWDKDVSQYTCMRRCKRLRELIGMREDTCLNAYLSCI